MNNQYDAVVVGSGPNGLSAAIVLAQAGLSVVVLEARDTPGGGVRSAETTLPGFVHDLGSAIHPLAVGSPFLKQLPLQQHGLEWVYPPVAVAHPFDGGETAWLSGSVAETAQQFGVDADLYLSVLQSIVEAWDKLIPDALGPLRWPTHPLTLARFGLDALWPATHLMSRFKTIEAQGLLAGMAAHAIHPLPTSPRPPLRWCWRRRDTASAGPCPKAARSN